MSYLSFIFAFYSLLDTFGDKIWYNCTLNHFRITFRKSCLPLLQFSNFYSLACKYVLQGRVLINIPSGMTDITNVINEINPRSFPLNWWSQIVSMPNIVASPRCRWNINMVEAANTIQFSFELSVMLRWPTQMR